MDLFLRYRGVHVCQAIGKSQWFALWVITFGSIVFPTPVSAQCPSPSFSAPSSVCINESFIPQNTSTGAARVDWDFCAQDLLQTPAVSGMGALASLTSIEDIKMVSDNGQWYGFALGRQSNTMARLEFGTNLSNASPFIIAVGNPGNLLNAPTAIELVKEGAKWLAIVLNSGNSKLILLDFGNSLANTPTASEIYSSIGSSNGSMTVIQIPGGGGVALVSDFNSNNVKAVRFDNGFANVSSGISTVSVSGNSNPIDLHAVERCGNWYVYVIGYSGRKITRLDYLQDFVNPPTQTTYGSPSISANPYRIWAGREGNAYHLLMSLEEGTLVRADLGPDPTNGSPTITSLGNFGVLANTWGLDVANENGRWFAFTVNGASSSKQVYQVSFPESCSASTSFSTAVSPGVISYSVSGSQTIALTTYDGQGRSSSVSAVVTVSASTAPTVSIGVDAGRCATHSNSFTANTADPIVSYNWDFGDGHLATGQNQLYQYGAAGTYDVLLTVAASNGCHTLTTKNLVIYNEPVANFNLPSVAQFCTNQSYPFVNTTQSDPGALPTWVWQVDGVNQSTAQNFSTLFNNTTSKTITLQATIPGCSSQKTSVINSINQGPLTDFTFNNVCVGTSATFANQTSGQVSSYAWAFGDGNTSGQTDGQNSFANSGNYDVTLVANNAVGCQNSATKTIKVYSKPLTDFSLDLPPFSCSGTTSQFHDITPGPTDSNLSTWKWTFGDAANGTSTDRDAQYTYPLSGSYTVGLTVTTNFGCLATTQKSITIAQSPVVSFTHGPACVNQGTQFTDTSVGSPKTWLWKIDNNTYTFFDPVQVFAVSGNYNAKLTVTDNNGCIAESTQTVSVPAQQFPDFTAQATCATKPADFQAATPLGTDPILSYSWNFGTLGTLTGSPVQFTFPETGTYSVKLDAHAQSGCVYSVSRSVAIVDPPVSGFTTTADAGAVPLPMTFTNTSSNASSYLWHFHDAANTTSDKLSPTFVFTELGDYVVDLDATNAAGCVDTFSKIIKAVVPSADAAISDVQFVQNTNGEWQVQFKIINVGNISITNPNLLVDLSGAARLTEPLAITILPGQTLSQELTYALIPGNITYVCVEVNVDQDIVPGNNRQCANVAATIALPPYPNPTSESLHLDWISPDSGTAHFMVFNSAGALTFNETVETTAGLNQIQLNVSGWTAGMYHLVFDSKGVRKTFRFAVP